MLRRETGEGRPLDGEEMEEEEERGQRRLPAVRTFTRDESCWSIAFEG